MICYGEAVEYFSLLEREDRWLEWCMEKNVFHFYTSEFVKYISELLNKWKTGTVKFNSSPLQILEIASGNGILGCELKNLGLPVIMTDINPINDSVEELSAADALKKYNPNVVIGSWLPSGAGIESQIINHPSVKCFINICQEINGSIGNDFLIYLNNWEKHWLSEIQNYSLCRYDYSGPFDKIIKHSHVIQYLKII